MNELVLARLAVLRLIGFTTSLDVIRKHRETFLVAAESFSKNPGR